MIAFDVVVQIQHLYGNFFAFSVSNHFLNAINSLPDVANVNRFLMSFSAHIIPGALLLTIPYINNATLVISILTASLGFNGAATLTNLQNTQDLGPNFAGTLYSIINFIGMTSGVLGPLLKSNFEKYGPEVSFKSILLICDCTKFLQL